MLKTIISAITALVIGTGMASASGGDTKITDMKWSFEGPFGSYDRSAVKRGFQVYSEVCASCHSLNLMFYRHLSQVGFSEAEIKAISAEVEVEDGPNDEGEMFTRPGRPSDRFVSPHANEQAARAANNGAMPPDLSLMIKARKNGADYLYSLLTEYKDEAPKGVTLMDGMNYNAAFTGNQIAMAPPLDSEAVEYADGTKPTLEQHAQDIVTFLAWTASPEMEERKRLGIKVMIFLLVLTGMLYAIKRHIWAKLH